jgi:hypothetical protein
MIRMHDWLDRHGIGGIGKPGFRYLLSGPILFREIAYEAGISGFELRFALETEAQLFNEAFG